MEQLAQQKLNCAWDWDITSRLITDLDQWREQFSEVQELVVSQDGERIAAIVKAEDDTFTVCVNGVPWTHTFEKVWSLQFGPDNRLVCIGMNDDEWTVVQEDEPWDESFDYVWNLRFSPDGKGLAANTRTSDGYGIALNGESWENRFIQMRSCEISPDGLSAAGNVQIEPLSEGDIFTFDKGLWSLAVNGQTWDAHFLNVWNCAFSDDASKVAAEVRIDRDRQTIARAMVNHGWKPSERSGSHDLFQAVTT